MAWETSSPAVPADLKGAFLLPLSSICLYFATEPCFFTVDDDMKAVLGESWETLKIAVKRMLSRKEKRNKVGDVRGPYMLFLFGKGTGGKRRRWGIREETRISGCRGEDRVGQD